MPQIEEYLPQVSVPEGIGGVSPNTEFAGALGRGLESFGSSIEDSAHVMHSKNAQQETADVYAHFADQRAYWTNKLQQQTQDGTLNVDKFTEDFENSSGQMGDNLSTSEGKNYFERQQARLKGSLLQQANAGMAQVASNEAKGKWQDAINKSSSSLMQDPSSFHDVYEQGLESVDQLVKTGGLPEKFRSKAELQMGLEFSKGAIRGWAELDPEKAKHMLDQGAFDQFLDTDQKHQMLMEVDRYAKAQDIEGKRSQKAIEDDQKAQSEKWGQDHLQKLSDNALSTKEVLGAVQNGTLKWEQGEKWLNMIKEGTKEGRTNPTTKNDLIKRIVNPESTNPITSQEDLMPYVGNGITITDFNQLNSLFHKTPEQQAIAQGEKALFDSARKTIRFKNMMTNQYDVLGEKKLAQYMGDYIQAKKDIQASGGQLSDLTNPNSPSYFGNKLESYQTSAQDQMNHMSQDRTDKALGLKSTGSTPNPTPVKQAKKPNESPADYLKRMNK